MCGRGGGEGYVGVFDRKWILYHDVGITALSVIKGSIEQGCLTGNRIAMSQC